MKLSVIIPMRNEEKNIPLLLSDLKNQIMAPFEVICVDDDSKDRTFQEAKLFPVRLLSVKDKPKGWVGKSWACLQGAKQARGDLLLFLDADVRLEPQGIGRLLKVYQENQKPLSVQPYHRTEKMYEQFSLIFNMVQMAANGMALPKPKYIGFFGPIVLMSKEVYWAIGGHEAVKNSIVEDLDLGKALEQANIPYELYLGDQEISYRMYGDGFSGLFQGWTKNQWAGARRTTPGVLFLVFFWISSLISVPLQLFQGFFQGSWGWLIFYGVLYWTWVILLWKISSKVGKFQRWAIIGYPILLTGYLLIFLTSVVKGIFGLPTKWKERNVDGRSDS